MKDFPKVLFERLEIPNIHKISVFQEHGGYQMAKRALQMAPEEVTKIVTDSGLRGRGGAGFPTGMKWSFVPKDASKIKYLLCNGDESEPGTFKDRILMEKMPHLLLEGMIIAAHAIDCHRAYIYIRGEFTESIAALEKAIEDCHTENILGKNIFGTKFNLEIHVFKGAGAYICGEETGLISSLEGTKGWPKVKPPFPAIAGFNRLPSIVNNVETLAAVPWILKNGAQAYRKFGTEKSPGTKLFCLSGPVKNPGTYELPCGFPLKDLIFDIGGGLLDDLNLKAVIPGGASAKILTAEEALKTTLCYEGCQTMGTMLGSGGVIVIPHTQCMVDLLHVVSYFFKDESCGQCTPCREGTGWMHKIVDSILHQRGRPEDVQLLLDISENIQGGRTICALADAAAWPVESYVKKFKQEFVDHIEKKACNLYKYSASL
ncbi:MAG: NADH oxidoreductase (quinone) subunit F [Deltaproteobacteria bacterium RIFCSPHIGHO2_02_FULL_40_11]|nr:MAG: NADH oxidoreductase (quinone) subunit F [Deltaproteobacteria bacterium RIFCSPHIGHO2_02_FULL_40_11]